MDDMSASIRKSPDGAWLAQMSIPVRELEQFEAFRTLRAAQAWVATTYGVEELTWVRDTRYRDLYWTAIA